MSKYLVKRCPGCGDQLPTYFNECIYCKTSLSEIEPSERRILVTMTRETRPRKRFSIPRIKKFKGYEKLIMDATPEEAEKRVVPEKEKGDEKQ